ncbi:cytoplasmic tRNA 2-thiolation protein 2-like isoform X1 [Poecilia formosa]|uniref:cytoplasmic tRNA 2-thiolation protein 2-like isoform X1 n=1 Tax=Poecilia formosa TaxID=48698 RepID=UPI000443AC20|nr:PREDICTED: cytoplasmic tRNA 2-thiolation protein 2-like isoform X1 [Poecilia formosa]
MCQVEEEYHEQLERVDAPSASKKCVKCKEELAAVVIRAGDAYCRKCFRESFIHKFRAMLGKTRVIFPGEKVLLAVSGGPSSCSMLSQVQEGVSQNAHKKLRFFPGIVYIDEGGALGQCKEMRQKTTSELCDMFRSTGFPFYILPLEQVLDLPGSVLTPSPPSDQPGSVYKAAVDLFLQSGDSSSDGKAEEQECVSLPAVQESHTRLLQQLIGSAQTLTAKQDLLNTFRQHLLVHTARTRGYSKLMQGDSCTRLAVKLLTSISLGRGAQLAQDTGFSDCRYGDVTVVRPMREYSAKEIAYYNHMFKVPSVVIPNLDTKMPDKASIQRLTQNFVTKLQADFHSTVSTIYRTGEKLQTAGRDSSAAEDAKRCVLCVCGLDTAAEEASALQATLISEQLSQSSGEVFHQDDSKPLKPEPPANVGQCCSSERPCGGAEGTGDCCRSSRDHEATDLRSLLCYSCRRTVRDMSSVDCLPQYVLSVAQRRQNRSAMKEQISEFLLDDADENN